MNPNYFQRQVHPVEGFSRGIRGRFYNIEIDLTDSRDDIIVPDSTVNFFVPDFDPFAPVTFDYIEWRGYQIRDDQAHPVTVRVNREIILWPPKKHQKQNDDCDESRSELSRVIVQIEDNFEGSLELRRRTEVQFGDRLCKSVFNGKEGCWHRPSLSTYKHHLKSGSANTSRGISSWSEQVVTAVPLPSSVFVPDSNVYRSVKFTPTRVVAKVALKPGHVSPFFLIDVPAKEYNFWPPIQIHQMIPLGFVVNCPKQDKSRSSQLCVRNVELPFTTCFGPLSGVLYRAHFLPFRTMIPAGEDTINGKRRKWTSQESVAVHAPLEVFVPTSLVYSGPIFIGVPQKTFTIVQLSPVSGESSFVKLESKSVRDMKYNFWPPVVGNQMVPESYWTRASNRHAIRTELIGSGSCHLDSITYLSEEEMKIKQAYHRNRQRPLAKTTLLKHILLSETRKACARQPFLAKTFTNNGIKRLPAKDVDSEIVEDESELPPSKCARYSCLCNSDIACNVQ